MSDLAWIIDIMTRYHLPQSDRGEMLRAHAGLVTTIVSDDADARADQLKSIVQEHLEKSHGDVGVFAARMAKQVEAGALITHSIMRMLSKRLNLSEQETQVIVAQAIGSVDDTEFPA